MQLRMERKGSTHLLPSSLSLGLEEEIRRWNGSIRTREWTEISVPIASIGHEIETHHPTDPKEDREEDRMPKATRNGKRKERNRKEDPWDKHTQTPSFPTLVREGDRYETRRVDIHTCLLQDPSGGRKENGFPFHPDSKATTHPSEEHVDPTPGDSNG